MRGKWLIWSLMMVVLLVGRALAEIPLPEYQIEPAPADAPPVVKNLLGKWHGYWDANPEYEAVFIIKGVDLKRKRARCIYAWIGDYRAFEVPLKVKPGKYAKIEFGGIIGGGVRVDFIFKLRARKNVLEGIRASTSIISRVDMQKIQ